MISVCIASHNGEKYIKEQLESILYQLDTTDEIIISDDGSSDLTIDIIKSFNDKRIKLINFKQPFCSKKGSQKLMQLSCRNFENALMNASGDYIFLCDQDDIWDSSKIETTIKYLKDYDIIKHDFSTINENGDLIKLSNYNAINQINRNIFHLIKTLPFRGCCIAFKKSLLNDCLPFPKNCLQHDSWISLFARFKNAKFYYIDRPLIRHRIHSDNVSELKSPNNLTYKIKYRSILILQILKRIIQLKLSR